MVPSWLIELSLGGSWVDVSDRLMGSISINRGRPNELASISAGQASFVLDNSDGAFTPDWSGSPYYPDVAMFTPVRISAHDGSGWVRRFTGYVQEWPVSWTVATGAQSVVTCSCVDLLALMGLKTLRSQRDERIMALSPLAWWPFADDSATAKAQDVIGWAPDLLPVENGTGGTMEWGATGAPASAEGAGSVLLTRVSENSNGWYLKSDGALGSLGTEFSVVSIATPTTDGYLWSLTQGTFKLALYYNAATSKYSIRQYNGSSWSTLVSTSATKTGQHLEVVTVSATAVVLRSDATHTAMARAAATFTGPTFYAGYCSDSTSGFDDMIAATLSGVAIVPGVMDMTDADALATAILSPAAVYADDFMETVLGWAGFPGETVGYVGAQKSIGGLLQINGSTPAGVADLISQGADGQFAVMLDGSLSWVDGGYAPTLLELDAADAEPSIVWATDVGAYVTDLTTSLPSGGSYTYTAPTAGLFRASRQITGVLATDAACKELVQFVVGGSSLAPRLPNAAFDLLTMADDATVADLLALDLGGQFSLSNLPIQIPDDRVMVVEGHTETIGAEEWLLTFNTSPSTTSLPPEGWYYAYVDDAATFIDDTPPAYIANR